MEDQYKIYLVDNDFQVLEVKRFSHTLVYRDEVDPVLPFPEFVSQIFKSFPQLADSKNPKITWKDEDGDNITVSSAKDYHLAMQKMRLSVKKFYVKMGNAKQQQEHAKQEQENSKQEKEHAKQDTDLKLNHPNVYCDGCNKNIVGFRYKCIVCSNYDLCPACEQSNIHFEHLMLRIPNPFMFEKVDLYKAIHILSSYITSKMDDSKHHSHHRRRHSHDACGDSKKKKKLGKHESGPDTDESEENCAKKHHHGKFKKMNKCAYSQLMNEFFNYWDPSQVQGEETLKSDPKRKSNGQAEDDLPHIKYLKSVGNTLTALLDPLGINVDFEIRSKNDDKQNQKKTPEEKTETQIPTPSNSQQKEVHFAPQEATNKEPMQEKVDEISRSLANQKIDKSPEDDDWVSFDELVKVIKNENETPVPTGEFLSKRHFNKNVPTTSASSQEPQNFGFRDHLYPGLKTSEIQSGTSMPSGEFMGQGDFNKTSSTASAPPQESQNVEFKEPQTPNFSHFEMPSNPVVRQALEKMLSMGFTNDGGWLTHLLEAKNGDIYQALDVLAPHKKS